MASTKKSLKHLQGHLEELRLKWEMLNLLLLKFSLQKQHDWLEMERYGSKTENSIMNHGRKF